MYRYNQSGRTMLEMLSVMAIIGILSVLGVIIYRQAMNTVRADAIIKDVLVRANQVQAEEELNRSGRKRVYVPTYHNDDPNSVDPNRTKGAYGYFYTIETHGDVVSIQIEGNLTDGVRQALKTKMITYGHLFDVEAFQGNMIHVRKSELSGNKLSSSGRGSGDTPGTGGGAGTGGSGTGTGTGSGSGDGTGTGGASCPEGASKYGYGGVIPSSDCRCVDPKAKWINNECSTDTTHCPDHAVECDGSSFSCEDGYYKDETIGCAKCPSRVAKCSNATTPTACQRGYFLGTEADKLQCLSCPEHSTCTSKTTFTCDDGWKKEEDHCVYDGCPKNGICDEGSNVLKSCVDGYKKDENKCTKCVYSETCSGGVLTGCVKGYYFKNETECVQCPKNASECTSADDFSCFTGYFQNLVEKICEKCPLNSTSCTSLTDFECPEGYGHGESSCFACPLNAATCVMDGDTIKATTCKIKYFLKDDRCEKCPIGAETCDETGTIITKCLTGTFLGDNECHICPDNAECTDGINFDCITSYYKVGSECKILPEHAVGVNNGKLVCEENYFELDGEEGVCQPCPEGFSCA